MKLALVVVLFALAACGPADDPTGVNGRMNLEYRVGEQLMNACNLQGQQCVEWLAFKEKFEGDLGYMTTFENSLAQHKARVAAGGAV